VAQGTHAPMAALVRRTELPSGRGGSSACPCKFHMLGADVFYNIKSEFNRLLVSRGWVPLHP
jgi:hypothetical protein